MKAGRRKAREMALQILFQAEFLKKSPAQLIPRFFREYPQDEVVLEYAKDLACGVSLNRKIIDAALEKASENWKLSRMALVDRLILQVAAYEMQVRTDIPREVAIDEAIEISKKYGSEESASFVNGVLDRLGRLV